MGFDLSKITGNEPPLLTNQEIEEELLDELVEQALLEALTPRPIDSAPDFGFYQAYWYDPEYPEAFEAVNFINSSILRNMNGRKPTHWLPMPKLPTPTP